MSIIVVLGKPTTKQMYFFDFISCEIVYRNDTIKIGSFVQKMENLSELTQVLNKMISLGWVPIEYKEVNDETRAAIEEADEKNRLRKEAISVGSDYYDDRFGKVE